ncbi:MAG: amino acid transporter, partial [Bdellovibrionales bacterium]
KQGLLPSPLAKVHPRRHTPHRAAGLLLLVLLALALSGDISSLAKSTSVLLLMCFVIVNTSLAVLKLRKDEAQGSFEVPLLVPILGALVCGALLLNAQGPELKTAGIILAVIAALYLFVRPSASAVKSFEGS